MEIENLRKEDGEGVTLGIVIRSTEQALGAFGGGEGVRRASRKKKR